jgi:hypothetical protein
LSDDTTQRLEGDERPHRREQREQQHGDDAEKMSVCLEIQRIRTRG